MKPFITIMLLAYCSCAIAQHGSTFTSNVNSLNSTTLTGGNDAFVYGRGIDLSSKQYLDVSGSPFLNQDFKPAFIEFKSGKKYSNVPVKFDMLNNELDIQDKGILLSLEELDSISFPDSNYQNMILKTGYPPVGKYDTNSIYQIVAQNNKIQLLKYYHCQIATIKTLGLPDRTSFDVDNQYYLFDKATKELRAVKLNKKSLPAALAEMGYPKAELDSNKNVDFKEEKEVASLISSANW